jgi:hypothetical protein
MSAERFGASREQRICDHPRRRRAEHDSLDRSRNAKQQATPGWVVKRTLET